MNVAVIGLGYIGLPTAALFARAGHRVYGYDRNPIVRRSLRSGEVDAGEPAVRAAVAEALASERLHVVDRIPQAQAFVICVPTPTHEGKPDLSYVENAAAAVAAVARPGALLVLESTVPPGTTVRVFERALLEAGKAIDDFHVAHCPERVIPGRIIEELRTNARVVGGRTPEDAQLVRALYASFCDGEIACTTPAVAEFVKVVENTYRDVNIAFANELAMFAEELGLDVWETIALANKHPRVAILSPGPGVGGHCIPVDPHFLADVNPFVTEVIQAARRVNDRMPLRVVRRIVESLDGPPPHKVALLGASYKADVDDARETPTARIDALLRERGIETSVYDPLVRNYAGVLTPRLDDAARGADALVLLVGHTAFAQIDPVHLAGLVRAPMLIDTRNFFDRTTWERAGFTCSVLGRPNRRIRSRAVA